MVTLIEDGDRATEVPLGDATDLQVGEMAGMGHPDAIREHMSRLLGVDRGRWARRVNRRIPGGGA